MSTPRKIYDNTATFTTEDTQATGDASASVNVCGYKPPRCSKWRHRPS